jgi:hypothetical protein
MAQREPCGADWDPLARARALVGDPAAAAVGLLIVLGAALRFYGLGHQGYWYDEANTVFLMRHSVGEMLGLLPTNESTPPFYYCVAWVWTQVFGSGEAGLRSLSALFGVLVIPAAFVLGSAACNRRVGLVLAALVTCNPLLIWYSQEARAYALMVLMTVLTLVALTAITRNPTARTFAAWAVAAIVALTTHYYAVLIVAPEAVWLLWHERRRRSAQIALAAVTVAGAALIPLALSQNGTHRDRWISRAPLGPRLGQLIPQLLIGPSVPDRTLIKFIAFAIGASGLVLVIVRTRAHERRTAIRFGAAIAFAAVLNLVFIAVGYDDVIARNLLALAVPALLVLAVGLGARRAGALGLVAAGVLCALGVTAAVGVASDRDLQRPDWRPLVQMLGHRPPRRGPGRAFLIQDYRMLLPMSLYMPGLRRIAPRTGAVVNQIDVISVSAPHVSMCWWGAACNLPATRPQSSYPFPGFHFVWRRRVRQFTVEHFVSRHPVRIRSRTIAPVLTLTVPGKDDLLFQR